MARLLWYSQSNAKARGKRTMSAQVSQDLTEILQRIGTQCREDSDLNEREVIDLFIARGFFAALRYGALR